MVNGNKPNGRICHNCGVRPSCFFIPHHFAWGLEEPPEVCEVCIMLSSDKLAANLCRNIGGFVLLAQRRSLADELGKLKAGRA